MIRPVSFSPPLARASPVDGGEVRREPGAAHVDPHDDVEVVGRHVPDGPVPDDARVVDQDVEAPVGVDRLIDELLGRRLVADVAVVGHGGAAAPGDQVHGEIGVTAAAVPADRRADVVDDDLGPPAGQLERVPPPDAVTGPGHDAHLVFQQSFHGTSPLAGLSPPGCLDHCYQARERMASSWRPPNHAAPRRPAPMATPTGPWPSIGRDATDALTKGANHNCITYTTSAWRRGGRDGRPPPPPPRSRW